MKRLPVPSRSSLPESWCGCICQCWRPPFKTQIRGGQISSWVSLKNLCLPSLKENIEAPNPKPRHDFKGCFSFSSKTNKLQTSNLFTKFANKNLSENLKSLRVTQKRKWRFLLATRTLEKEWKSASEWWKKKSVFKNLCHQIAMIKTAGVQLNMWWVLGGYIQYPGLYLWIVVSYYMNQPVGIECRVKKLALFPRSASPVECEVFRRWKFDLPHNIMKVKGGILVLMHLG